MTMPRDGDFARMMVIILDSYWTRRAGQITKSLKSLAFPRGLEPLFSP
jgi:hypothetical protein